MTRLVVFDLDGTLVDSARQIVASMQAGYAAAGREAPSPAAILSIVGISLPQAVERLSPGIDGGERDRIVTAYRTAFHADPETPPLYPGVAESLAELSGRPGLTLSVASGKSGRGIAKVLDQHGLRRLFGSLHGGDEYPSKPDPAMLRAAMTAAGVGPERTVMVGDSLFDIHMAQAAGVPSLAVAWGFCPAEELRAAGAVAILERFDEVQAIVGEIGSAAA